eukprot:PhF_6_TR17362/c0_g1_i1/m.26586
MSTNIESLYHFEVRKNYNAFQRIQREHNTTMEEMKLAHEREYDGLVREAQELREQVIRLGGTSPTTSTTFPRLLLPPESSFISPNRHSRGGNKLESPPRSSIGRMLPTGGGPPTEVEVDAMIDRAITDYRMLDRYAAEAEQILKKHSRARELVEAARRSLREGKSEKEVCGVVQRAVLLL